MRLRPARYAVILPAAGLFLAAALAACGVKTAPYPEAATLPNKVRGLAQAVTEDGELILSWRPPETNMVGRPLKSLGGFQVEMADSLADEHYCLGCPTRYLPEPVDRLPAASPPPGLPLAPGPYEWRRRLENGHVYHFRVTAVSAGGGAHPDAKVETVVWAVPPPGALRLSAAPGDRSVDLSWPRPGPDQRVEIEKRSGEGAWAPLAALEPSAGRFSDLAVAYENSYAYRGRLVRFKEETGARGPWSPELKITVVDLTPPNPPGYLDAALTEGGVRLAWESLIQDPEVAGYRIYRQRGGELEPRLITPATLRENAFFDPVVPEGDERLRYQVTAVDKSPRANESRPSPAADVYLDPPTDEPVRPQ